MSEKLNDVLIGKTIIALRGSKRYKKQKNVELEYILLNDNKTIICLDNQDYYSYHDCSSNAKEITIKISTELWQNIKNDNDHYGDIISSDFIWIYEINKDIF